MSELDRARRHAPAAMPDLMPWDDLAAVIPERVTQRIAALPGMARNAGLEDGRGAAEMTP